MNMIRLLKKNQSIILITLITTLVTAITNGAVIISIVIITETFNKKDNSILIIVATFATWVLSRFLQDLDKKIELNRNNIEVIRHDLATHESLQSHESFSSQWDRFASSVLTLEAKITHLEDKQKINNKLTHLEHQLDILEKQSTIKCTPEIILDNIKK